MTKFRWESLDLETKVMLASRSPVAAQLLLEEQAPIIKMIAAANARFEAIKEMARLEDEHTRAVLEKVYGRTKEELAETETGSPISISQPPSWIREILEAAPKQEESTLG